MKSRAHSPWEDPYLYLAAAGLLIVVDLLAVESGFITDKEQFKLKIVELVLEIAVIGIVGAVIKHAIDEHRATTSFRSEIIASLGEIHRKVYALRRRLALQPNDHEVVRERVFELMTIRSELGDLGHHVRTKRDIGQQTVRHNIDSIRDYFEELTNEAMQGAQDGKMTIGPKLQQFIVGSDGSADGSESYIRRFKAPYVRAKSAADPDWELSNEQKRISALPLSE